MENLIKGEAFTKRIRLTQRRILLSKAHATAEKHVIDSLTPVFKQQFRKLERFLRKGNLRKRLGKFEKHYGPGNHPSGSSQEVHSHEWTPDEALKEYQGGMYNSKLGGYAIINHYLRTGEIRYGQEKEISASDIEKVTEALDSSFELSTEDKTLYRGVQTSEHLQGDSYTDQGYLSTDTSKKKASSFAEKLNYRDTPKLLEVRVPKGFPLIEVSKITGRKAGLGGAEHEWLLPRNTTYKIERKGSKIILIPQFPLGKMDLNKGEAEGHPFRGNQWTTGEQSNYHEFWQRKPLKVAHDTSAHPLFRRGQYTLWGGSHSGSWAITGESAELMGLAGYSTDKFENNRKIYSSQASAMLEDIRGDKVGSEEELFHGFENVAKIEWKEGDTFEIPLTALAGDPDTISYGIRSDVQDQRGEPTLLVIPKKTPIVAYGKWKASDAKEFGHVYTEAITAGKFRVKSIDQRVYPYAWQHDSQNHEAYRVKVRVVELEWVDYPQLRKAQDLSLLIAQCLKWTAERKIAENLQKGEAAGHPFRGNQYEEGEEDSDIEYSPSARRVMAKLKESVGTDEFYDVFELLEDDEITPQLLDKKGVLESGKKARLIPMRENFCHGNASALVHQKKAVAIGTGFAFIKDKKEEGTGVWVQHSWGYDSEGRILETTIKRDMYFGIKLTGKVLADFVETNIADEYLKSELASALSYPRKPFLKDSNDLLKGDALPFPSPEQVTLLFQSAGSPTENEEEWNAWKKALLIALLLGLFQATEDLAEVENLFWLSRGREELTYDAETLILAYQLRTGRPLESIALATFLAIERLIREWYVSEDTFSQLLTQLNRYFNETRIQTIAKTEVGNLLAQMVAQQMVSYGLNNWYWDAMGEDPCKNDIHIRGIIYEGCSDLNGRHFVLGDPMPPDAAHPNCQCLPTIREDLRKPIDRKSTVGDLKPTKAGPLKQPRTRRFLGKRN